MKNRNLLKSFDNAIRGIQAILKTERNFKIHILIASIVLVLSLIFRLTKIEFILVCLTIGLVLISEMFNTAIEHIVDMVVDTYHPKAKLVKDISAGAVLLSASLAVVVGFFIFYNKIEKLIEPRVFYLKQSPINVIAFGAIITLIAVFTLKAYFEKGTPMTGGMPSGHAALAFSVATSIVVLSDNFIIALLGIFLALLVVQSRFQSKIHTVFELFAGAIIGSLITLLILKILM